VLESLENSPLFSQQRHDATAAGTAIADHVAPATSKGQTDHIAIAAVQSDSVAQPSLSKRQATAIHKAGDKPAVTLTQSLTLYPHETPAVNRSAADTPWCEATALAHAFTWCLELEIANAGAEHARAPLATNSEADTSDKRLPRLPKRRTSCSPVAK